MAGWLVQHFGVRNSLPHQFGALAPNWCKFKGRRSDPGRGRGGAMLRWPQDLPKHLDRRLDVPRRRGESRSALETLGIRGRSWQGPKTREGVPPNLTGTLLRQADHNPTCVARMSFATGSACLSGTPSGAGLELGPKRNLRHPAGRARKTAESPKEPGRPMRLEAGPSSLEPSSHLWQSP